MRCLPALTVSSDQPYWVPRQSFFEQFDQEDFRCRESTEVAYAYLADWFGSSPDGVPRFLLPAVQFIGGKTQFISGRHRTAVLLPYLWELPMAFTRLNHPDEGFLRCLNLRPLALHEFIELPDLPTRKRLP